jgi:hypothetical protein
MTQGHMHVKLVIVQGKIVLCRIQHGCMNAFLTSALGGNELSVPRPVYPTERVPVNAWQEAGSDS